MPNPVIAEVTRGRRVESIHRGAFVAMDAEGRIVDQGGEIDMPVFARSSLKLMQALVLVESGAADRFGFGDRELALACASHSSEPDHVETAARMLAAAGLGEGALGCGPHWPQHSPEHVAAMARAGQIPTRLHNNCSGKHAGFLCTCVHLGEDVSGYLDPAHPLQVEIRATIADLTGFKLEGDVCAIDGCSAPTYAAPLSGFAQAFAHLATGEGLERERASAARRLMDACMAEPWMVAGSDRFCTRIMQAGAGRIYAKVGAEGVYVAALPEEGIGIAMKCDDGAARAVEVRLAALIGSLLKADDPLKPGLKALADEPIHDRNGTEVGRLRAVS